MFLWCVVLELFMLLVMVLVLKRAFGGKTWCWSNLTAIREQRKSLSGENKATAGVFLVFFEGKFTQPFLIVCCCDLKSFDL